MMPPILVIGASGAVGGFLLTRLHAAGCDVLALSRTERAPRDGVRWLRGGLDDAFVAPAVESVICVGPLDQFVAWLERAQTPALRRVVALSSMSADSKRDSLAGAERELAQRLAASEQRLARHCDARGIAWTVLRPTLIYGAGVDRSLSPIVRWARRTRVFPLVAQASGLRQPVHADDVAAACVAALTDAARGRVLPLGGGERLTYAAMLDRVRAGAGCATVPLPLRINLLRFVTRITGRGGGMVQRLTRDLIADNTAAHALLGWSPRAFQPRPDCWQHAKRTTGNFGAADSEDC
jgi:nucleoside-diphosphate-sugar epimerase